jgi:hypothetical protein
MSDNQQNNQEQMNPEQIAPQAAAQPTAVPAQPQPTPAQPTAVPAQPQPTPAQPTPAQPQALDKDAEMIQLLKDIKKNGRRQLIWSRVLTVAMVGIFLVVGYAAFIFIPIVVDTMDNINNVVTGASATIENIDVMVAEMTDASQNLNQLVNDNAKPLTDAVTNLSNIDFDGLNKAIRDLQDAIGPMAEFMNKFR